MTALKYHDIAKMIDHSLLKPTMTDAEMQAGCRLAREYDVASVCIKPYAVKMAAEILAGSSIAVGTTIGFPHGGHATPVKVEEAKEALTDGARELDMVVNIGKVLSGDWDYVGGDILAVIEVAHEHNAIVKVIFENCWLHDEQKERLCILCGELGADFVKTSTGFGDGGATDHDLRLMRHFAPKQVQVKAAGGIRTYERVLAIRGLEISRVGTSATKEILDECKQKLGMYGIKSSAP